MEQDDRILQALILSQYRLKVAENNRIYCKPVILFKAQKTIEESENNLKNFEKLIKNLEVRNLEKIKNISKDGIIQKAFLYFEKQNISLENLVKELKEDFASECCLSANCDKET
jgi:type III restriction enzyme